MTIEEELEEAYQRMTLLDLEDRQVPENSGAKFEVDDLVTHIEYKTHLDKFLPLEIVAVMQDPVSKEFWYDVHSEIHYEDTYPERKLLSWDSISLEDRDTEEDDEW